MQVLINCMQCFQEQGRPTNKFIKIEYRDDGRYETICNLGHTTITVLQEQKFEVLFEIGANAILDGYYRESVSSFAASLERFYEFSLRVLITSASQSQDLFDNCWKKVKPSERQLGAFVFMWASHFDESPKLLSDENVNYRNNVIHKGKIPTREMALKYGDAVLAVIRPKQLALQKKFSKEVLKVSFDHIRNCVSHADSDKIVSTLSIPTILRANNAESSLEQYLINLMERRKLTTGLN